MTESLSILKDFSFGAVILRLALAMLCGGAVGYGRSKKERSAGLRTYMLISIGAAMAVILGLYQYDMLMGQWKEITDEVGLKFDASRLAAQAITGIGFLGAGIIIKASHQQVKGLTTATGLFATVCMGIAAGVGFYEIVIMALVITVLILNVMSPLEAAFKRRLRNITLHVEFQDVSDIEEITEVLKAQEAQVFDIDIERTEWDGNHAPSAIFIMQMSKKEHSHSAMLTSLAELDCVYSVQELIA